jgi:hypothetical protein
MPLGPQIQALWHNPETAREMMYRCEETKRLQDLLDATEGIVNVFSDIFHGQEYLQAVERDDIKDGDFVLIASWDGAQLYRDKQSDCWIFIFIIMDLRPGIRYKKKYITPAVVIPGPNNPKNTDSFFFPTFHHISALQREGLKCWNSLTGSTFISRPFYLLGSADGPGSVHVTGLVGHHGAYPCRLYCSMKGRHKPNIPHYCPAMLKPHNYTIAGCDHPDISASDIRVNRSSVYLENLEKLLKARNITHYAKLRKETGISRPSIVSGLQPRCMLPIESTFAGDSMHALTLNMGELWLSLWHGTM